MNNFINLKNIIIDMAYLIMIVDDDHQIITLLPMQINSLNYNCDYIICEETNMIIPKFNELKKEGKLVDLIFFDKNMPGNFKSEDLVTHARNLFLQVKTIAISGSILTSEREKYQNLGFTDILSKPFGIPDLKVILDKYLQK